MCVCFNQSSGEFRFRRKSPLTHSIIDGPKAEEAAFEKKSMCISEVHRPNRFQNRYRIAMTKIVRVRAAIARHLWTLHAADLSERKKNETRARTCSGLGPRLLCSRRDDGQRHRRRSGRCRKGAQSSPSCAVQGVCARARASNVLWNGIHSRGGRPEWSAQTRETTRHWNWHYFFLTTPTRNCPPNIVIFAPDVAIFLFILFEFLFVYTKLYQTAEGETDRLLFFFFSFIYIYV